LLESRVRENRLHGSEGRVAIATVCDWTGRTTVLPDPYRRLFIRQRAGIFSVVRVLRDSKKLGGMP
ncbi:MAG: hypothetical protein ACRER2_14455, partial [Methylococcales bacterium]